MGAKRIVRNEVKSKRGRPKAAALMKRVNISVDPNDYEAFDKLGKDTGLSIAWLIRKAMREFLIRQPDGGDLVSRPSTDRRGARI